MLPNCVEMVLTLFAAWRMGVAVTPVNPALTTGEASYQLADSGAKVVIADAVSAGKLSGRTSVSYRSMRSAASAARRRPWGPKLAISPCSYTSGTTGRPKGVMLDHANLAAMTEQIVTALEIGAATCVLLVLPLTQAVLGHAVGRGAVTKGCGAAAAALRRRGGAAVVRRCGYTASGLRRSAGRQAWQAARPGSRRARGGVAAMASRTGSVAPAPVR